MSDDKQDLVVEVRLRVSAPKMISAKLAEGVKAIISRKWPSSVVSLEEVLVVSVADAKLVFKKEDDV